VPTKSLNQDNEKIASTISKTKEKTTSVSTSSVDNSNADKNAIEKSYADAVKNSTNST
jgi:hypothetical protein